MLRSLLFQLLRRPAIGVRGVWGTETALAALILFITAVRVFVSAVLPLQQDEAYHHLFIRHASLSFYDHPPMVMWVGWVGTTLFGGLATPLAARFGFVLLMTGSLWILARLTARWYGPRAGFYAAALLAASGYHGTTGGMIFPESPLLFFTLLTIWAAVHAVSSERLLPWVGVGLAFAGAMLSKYFAVFLPAGVFAYLIIHDRRRLLTPGPYLAIIIGFIGFAPVLIWNAQNGWASFAFQGGRATAWKFDIEMALGRQVTAVVCLLPWIWAVLIAGMLHAARSAEKVDRLLFWLALVPTAVLIPLSFVRPVLPHWLLYSFLPLFPFGGARLAAWSVTRPRAVNRGIVAAVAVICIGGLAIVAQVKTGFLPLPKDPTADFGCWAQVVSELKARGLADRPNTFVFASQWNHAAQLEYNLRHEPVRVACYDLFDAKGYAYWSRPAEYVGMDGIYFALGRGGLPPELYTRYFRSVELIAEIPLARGGHAFGSVRLYLCTEQFKAFPFDGRTAGPYFERR